jgi:Flp pilus assembly protein TadG
MVVGATDFGRAYNLKQKLTNAAREGARIAINQSTADLSQNVPNTVQAVRNSVVAYLNSENLDTSFIAANPTKTGVREWTYSSTSSGDPILRIDRSYPVPVTVDGTATLVISTRIRLAYPFSWSFARVINILKDCPQGSPGCYAGSFLIETEVIMKNMS